MFLDIQDAAEEIIEVINDSLGPIADISSGSINWLTTIVDIGVQLASTIILFIVVRFLFWKPITNILEKRREAIDKSLDEAAKAKENAERLEAQLEEELKESKARVKELLDQAEKDGNARREQIIEDAKEEARRRMENLELELAQEKANMASEIRQEIVDIAFKAAEKIVSKEIDQTKYLNVVDEILKEAE